ncbi:Smr/MutS family protein [Burkholderiaceae bacterium DAT-1]|nr:Smr/MutS family protein [Burkholderiaceae bacterium DAT-1]
MKDTHKQSLQALKATLKVRAADIIKPTPVVCDQSAWKKATQDVKPLKHAPRVAHPPLPPDTRRRHSIMEEMLHGDDVSDMWPWASPEDAPDMMFARPGQRLDTLKKLRKGQWIPGANLDLHGLNTDAARSAVVAFIQDMSARRIKCVRIVHGKGFGSSSGQPVLKLKLHNWLMQKPEVLAFCEAPHHSGGSGAVLILLRSGKSND